MLCHGSLCVYLWSASKSDAVINIITAVLELMVCALGFVLEKERLDSRRIAYQNKLLWEGSCLHEIVGGW